MLLIIFSGESHGNESGEREERRWKCRVREFCCSFHNIDRNDCKQFSQIFFPASPLTLSVGETGVKFMEIGSLVRVKKERASRKAMIIVESQNKWICIFLFHLPPSIHPLPIFISILQYNCGMKRWAFETQKLYHLLRFY